MGKQVKIQENNPYHIAVKSLIHCMRTHCRLCEKRISNTGVYRSQHHLLMELNKNNSASQIELAGKLEVSPATIAVTLKKLEKGGFIEKVMDEEDNRYNKVKITERGTEVVQESIRIFTEIDETMFQGFTLDEVEQFTKSLSKINDNLKRCMENTEKIE